MYLHYIRGILYGKWMKSVVSSSGITVWENWKTLSSRCFVKLKSYTKIKLNPLKYTKDFNGSTVSENLTTSSRRCISRTGLNFNNQTIIQLFYNIIIVLISGNVLLENSTLVCWDTESVLVQQSIWAVASRRSTNLITRNNFIPASNSARFAPEIFVWWLTIWKQIYSEKIV